MKKTLLILSVIFIAVACKNKEDKTEETITTVPEAKTTTGYAYSETFNQSMTSVLNAYYCLKDAFVASDTIKVNAAALQLKGLLDSLKLDEVQTFDTLGLSIINVSPGDVSD